MPRIFSTSPRRRPCFAAASTDAAADGEFEFAYRFAPAPTIYAGTSEIMRSLIAQLALGLPRSRS